jgi:hypothetical protein
MAVPCVLLPALLWILCSLCACGDDGDEPSSCAPPNRVGGEACIAPGVQDDGCPAGTLGPALGGAEGTCRPAGIVEGECGDGFVHDGDVGCEPILPAESCPDGLMAVPGDSACHPVMDCGAGTWGDIAIEPGTQFVDASFSGASDGSMAAPWATITDAVAAAPPGGLVAIAAGSYVEDLLISNKPVRLHGVCPAQIELVGTGVAQAALRIFGGANGSEVRGIAVRGPGIGVALEGSTEVLLDRLHVHDNASRGVNVQSDSGTTSFTLRASLLERNHELGVYVSGSQALVEASVVRDTLPDAQGLFGRGIGIQASATTGAPSLGTVRASLLERNHDLGVLVAGSEAHVEASVVRDTLPDAQGRFGRGISIVPSPATGAPALATVRASLLERNHELGVYVLGSEALVEASVVRDTLPDAQGIGGRAIGIEPDPDALAPSLATVRASLLERNHEFGVFLSGSEVVVEATVVRDTLPDAQGRFGRGINIQYDPDTLAPSLATVRASLVERSRDAGIFVAGAAVTVEGCFVAATTPRDDGSFGDGLVALFEGVPTNVFLDASTIEDSARAGLSNFGAFVSLGATAVRCAAFELEGEKWDGSEFRFEDRGGNACGCPTADQVCEAVSAGLEPPEPIPPLQ